MAVDWLDAARFADSNGYQVDRDREMYAWRDWVIRAFNDNKPFDQFTVEQIAGDLLPGATLDQRIATGFHRNHMINEEGGVIAEEFLAEYAADRVETTATVWLGQTLQLRALPRSQVRSLHPARFLQPEGVLPQRGREGQGRRQRQHSPEQSARLRNCPRRQLEAKIAALLQGARDCGQKGARPAR